MEAVFASCSVGSRPRHSTMEGAGFALLGSFHAASVAAIQGGRSV